MDVLKTVVLSGKEKPENTPRRDEVSTVSPRSNDTIMNCGG